MKDIIEEQRKLTDKLTARPDGLGDGFCKNPRPPRYAVNTDTAVPCVRDTWHNKDLELVDVVEMLNDYGTETFQYCDNCGEALAREGGDK
jgi:hypothetical protein